MTRRPAGPRARLLLLALAAVAAGPPAARGADEGAAPPSDGPAAPREAPACTRSAECAALLGHGHVCTAGRCVPYADRRDLFSVLGLSRTSATAPVPMVPLIAAIPVIGYSPASGVMLGFAGTAGLLLGDPADTTISSATGAIYGTTKKQLSVGIAGTVMTPGNTWELPGDWRYLKWNQDTYGLGSGVSPLATGVSINGLGDLAAIPGAQPMDFSLLRLHQSALRSVSGSTLYLGVGYRLDRHFGIVDRRLDLSSATPVVTSHWAYSRIEGFDPSAYTASGFSLEAISDTRDSTIASYRGWLAHLRFTGYPTWLGSTRSATLVSGEGRAYLGLSDADPRNLLALMAIAQAVTSGHLPYLALPAIGWHPASTTGRGYVQGRFRGTAMAYAEAEWRFRLTADGLLGGTLFANAETFARPAVSLPAYGYEERGERLFETIRPAGGVGLRIMLLKQSRTALRIDVAAGVESVCFYFGAGEAF